MKKTFYNVSIFKRNSGRHSELVVLLVDQLIHFWNVAKSVLKIKAEIQKQKHCHRFDGKQAPRIQWARKADSPTQSICVNEPKQKWICERMDNLLFEGSSD